MNIDETRVGLATCADSSFIASRIYEDSSLVSGLVRKAFVAGGLGVKDPDVPLADIIGPGMSVLLKPNWVLHQNMGNHGMDCMVTHPAFIEAVLQEVVKAKPERIILADAPIQRCVFEELVSLKWIDRLREIVHPCQLDIVDLRRTIVQKDGINVKLNKDIRELSLYVLFDLGSNSLLEPISRPDGKFRNTCYNPDDLKKSHSPGRHQYLLSKEPFEVDVVLNLPKLKAHRKAGITAALKNIVGINGDKNYLPHHRIGGSTQGGDCYEGSHPLKRFSEFCLDNANRLLNRPGYLPWKVCATTAIRLNKYLFGDNEIEGGWHGNDTVWRMTLDLNRILLYGRSDGTLSPTPLRKVYTLTDGIIAGQGFGPLAPEPVNLGAVTFSSSSVFAELVNATLMRFDWEKIPLIRESFSDYSYPLTHSKPEDLKVYHDGESLSLVDVVDKFSVKCKAAHGWQGKIEIDSFDSSAG